MATKIFLGNILNVHIRIIDAIEDDFNDFNDGKWYCNMLFSYSLFVSYWDTSGIFLVDLNSLLEIFIQTTRSLTGISLSIPLFETPTFVVYSLKFSLFESNTFSWIKDNIGSNLFLSQITFYIFIILDHYHQLWCTLNTN